MLKKVPLDILKGSLSIMKKFMIIQEFSGSSRKKDELFK